MLGHEKLTTTQTYAQVSLTKLKEIHKATHPARLHRRPATNGAQPPPHDDAQRRALLDALDREAAAES